MSVRAFGYAALVGSALLCSIFRSRKVNAKKNGAVLILGTGSMGYACAKRMLRRGRHDVIVWNRTFKKTKGLEILGARCEKDLIKALQYCHRETTVILFLANLDIAETLLLQSDRTRALLMSAGAILNLISASPTDAKSFAKKLVVSSPDSAEDASCCFQLNYVDASYAGTPELLASGSGLILSSSSTGHITRNVRDIMSALAKDVRVYNGPIGCAKAIDYAIVDMYFANMIFFLSGVGLAEAEGLTAEDFLELIELKVPTYASTFRGLLPRLANRDYRSSVTASIKTWTRFFECRMDYLATRNLNTDLAKFSVDFLKRVGEKGDSDDDDVYRIQEVLRFNKRA
eukprot:g4289.t1